MILCKLSGLPLRPVHPSSGVYRVTAVGTSPESIPLLACIWCLLLGPVHPSSGVYLPIWSLLSGQSIPILVCIWCLLAGPVHSSSGVYLEPVVGTNPSLFWCVFDACWQDQSIPLLVCIWSLL